MKVSAARFFFIVIPLLTLGYLWESQAQRRFADAQERFSRRLLDQAERLAVATDPELFLQRPMTAVLRRFQRRPETPLEQLAGVLASATGGCRFDLFVLPSAGQPVKATDGAENLWLMRRLLAALAEPPVGAQKVREVNRLLSNAFGLGIGLERFQRGRGRMIAVPFQGAEAYLAWEKTAKATLLVFCRTMPGSETRFRTALARTRVPPADWAGLLEPGGNWLVASGSDQISLSKAHQAFQETKLAEQRLLTRLFHFIPTRSGETIVLARSLPTTLVRHVWYGGRLAVPLLIPMLAWLGNLLQQRARIRGVIVGLLLITALVPLMELTQATLLTFEVRRSLLQTQVERGEQEVLRRVEEGVDTYLERFARRLESLMTESQVWQDVNVLKRKLEAFLRPPLSGVLEVRDRNGRILVRSEHAGIQELFTALQRMVFELWAPERIGPDYEKVDPFVLEFMRHPRTGFRMLSQRPRQFQLITSGTNNTYMYWDIAPENASGAAFLSLLFPSKTVIEDFLQHALLERTGLWDIQYRLCGVSIENQKAILADENLLARMVPFFERAQVLQRPLSGTLQWRGERWLITALASTALQGFGLAALFPEQAVDERLRHLKMRVGGVVCGTLLLALGFAYLVSRRFLRPVDELSQGVEAIRRKDFSAPVPVHSRDELGRLAQVFNQLAEELKDLDVARAVQTRMIPQEYPVVDGYDLYGHCQFAGDLGGDILECRRLADGRVFTMIGDVSGHGTASALLMAFVKAVVILWVQDQDPKLEELVRHLDRMLRADQTEGRFLAMFACLLDPRVHELTWVSGGHPYPLLCRPDHATEFLGMPCYPLGSRERVLPAPVRKTTLQPGESLWLYTDGLVEARGRSGDMLGYGALAEWVAAHGASGSAEERVAALRKMQEERAPEGDDDVTLFVLCRRAHAAGVIA